MQSVDQVAVPSFDKAFLQFANSIDIVREEACSDIRGLMRDYFVGHFGFHYYNILVDWHPAPNSRQLKTVARDGLPWSNGLSVSVSVPRSSRSMLKQWSVAYDEGKCLWITSGVGDILSPDAPCRNHWEQTLQELPPYHQPADQNDLTNLLILLPLKWQDHVFGLVAIEDNRGVPSNQRIVTKLQDELKRMAEAIGKILVLARTSDGQRKNSQNAIADLRDHLARLGQRTPWRRKAFVASPKKMENLAVMNSIRNMFSNHFPNVDVTYWNDNKQSGVITAHIDERIIGCDFGVCYLSELVEGTDDQYRDNLNVLYEAGMLHACSLTGGLLGWIPIREWESPQPPFDIFTQNILSVSRTDAGGLSRNFSSQLRDRITKLIGPEDTEPGDSDEHYLPRHPK